MYNFTAATCNSKLIIFGSGLTSTIFLQCYNPAVDSWSVARSPNVPRHLSAPVSVTTNDETKIFISGDNTKKVISLFILTSRRITLYCVAGGCGATRPRPRDVGVEELHGDPTVGPRPMV